MKIKFASDKKAKALAPYIKEILNLIDISGAWISDESIIGDFLYENKFDNGLTLEDLSKKLKFPNLKSNTYVIDIAEFVMKQKDN